MSEAQGSPAIIEEAADAAFANVARIFETARGLDSNWELMAMAGDKASYDALMDSGNRFLQEHPHALEGRIAPKEVMALWAGLVVGVALGRGQQPTEQRP